MGQVFNLGAIYEQVDRAKAAEQQAKYQGVVNEKAVMELDDIKLIRSTAQQSIDPETGQYSVELHAANLEKVRPELAHQFRQRAAEDAGNAIIKIEQVVTSANEDNWDQVRKLAGAYGVELPEKYDEQALEKRARVMRERLQPVAKWGKPKQVEGARPGVIAQEEERTGQLGPILDYPTKGVGGGRGGRYAPGPLEKEVTFRAKVLGISEEEALQWVDEVAMLRAEGYKPEQLRAMLIAKHSQNPLTGQQRSPEEVNAYVDSLMGAVYPMYVSPDAGKGRPRFDPKGKEIPFTPPAPPGPADFLPNDPFGIIGPKKK